MERLTFAASGKVEGRTLSGTAHVYGEVTVDGRRHAFAPGAFAKSIAAGKVVSFAYHDETKPLASQAAGTLRLEDGPQLGFAIETPETSYAADMRAYALAGNQLGMSFAIGGGGKFSRKDGVKTWTEVNLLSVDPVALPAFEGTNVVLNSVTDSVTTALSTAVRLRHQALRRK